MTYPEEKRYLDRIEERVDRLALEYGYGEVIVKIEIKDGKVMYVEFQVKEREKMT